MTKQLLFLFLGLFALSPIVKADEIKFTSASTKEITIAFTTAEAGTVTVDWGNGTPVSVPVTQTDIDGAATQAVGTPSGEITVSGNNITVFDCSSASLTALDVTKATSLKKLSFNGNTLTNVDLSQNTALYSLHAENNLGLQLDVTKNTALGLLYCNDSDLSTLDVTKNTLLTTLNFNNNKIVSIDLSKNTALKSIYALNNLIEAIDISKNTALTYVSFNANKLTSLDVTGLDALKSIFAMNNSLTSIIGANNAAKIGTVNITGNKLNLATLPQPEALKSSFNYAPQQAYVIAESIEEGKTLDLSSQNNVKGILTAPAATVYTWVTESNDTLAVGTDYTEANGVFTFLKAQTEKLVCSMTTTAFPKFTGASVFKTTPIEVKAVFAGDEIKFTSSSTKDITIAFTTAEAGTVSVDWGNGTPVTVEVTQTDMDGAATAVSGTPAGEVIVRGKDIIVFDCNTASVTALDVTNATNLKKLSFNDNSLTNVDLSQNVALYSLHAEGNLGFELDVTKNTALGLLYCNNNGMETIDITNNLALTTLNFNNNKISTLDFSKHTALKSIYALNNQFESVDLSKNTALTYISFNTNKLTKLDVTGLDALKSIFATNNNLTELIGANNAAKIGTVNITGNKLNLATLPQPEAMRTQFNYAPQQAYVIPESIEEGTELDLSSQNNVKGILAIPAATVYTWVTESNDTLVVGTDYTEVNGVFTFLKAQTEKLVCSMTTTAFPKFTGASVFKTTAIEVKGSSSINDGGSANIVVRAEKGRVIISNLNGQESVRIINTRGLDVYSTVNVSDVLSVELSEGLYIVLVDEVAHKVLVK